MARPYKRCSISGCDGDANAAGTSKGWCGKHYQRWKRTGDPELVFQKRGEALSFMRNIAAPCVDSDCLNWPFLKTRDGYGQVWFNSRLTGAHRAVCEIVNGPQPKGKMDAAHSCGNGHLGCVNGSHLRWDTRTGNLKDRYAHGTEQVGQNALWAKLTDTDVLEIRDLAKAMMQKDIAPLFNVSRATICAVMKGKRWGHVG